MWVVTCAVRQLCAAISYDRDAKHHYSKHETTVLMCSDVRRHVFCDVTELELWRKVASWRHPTDIRIHSNITFLNGIMMFCIPVIFDVSAELAQSTSDYSHLNSLRDSSKRLWLSTRLTKYLHFASRSETIFRVCFDCCVAPISLLDSKMSILRYNCFILCRRAANCRACTKSRCLGPAEIPLPGSPKPPHASSPPLSSQNSRRNFQHDSKNETRIT